MFLLRTAFWLILIILLLPTDETKQRQVFGTAEAAINDISGFCDRNPNACEMGMNAFQSFSEKAQFGAKMLIAFVKDIGADNNTTASVEREPLASGSDQTTGRDVAHQIMDGTLTADDLKPAWSAPKG